MLAHDWGDAEITVGESSSTSASFMNQSTDCLADPNPRRAKVHDEQTKVSLVGCPWEDRPAGFSEISFTDMADRCRLAGASTIYPPCDLGSSVDYLARNCGSSEPRRRCEQQINFHRGGSTWATPRRSSTRIWRCGTRP